MSLLQTLIPKNKYRTADYPNLDPSAEGAVKPWLHGRKSEINPVCVDGVNSVYHVADHAIREIFTVELGAELLTAGFDYDANLAAATIHIHNTPKLTAGGTYYFAIEGIEIDAANHLQFYAEASADFDDYILISGATPGVWSDSATGRSVCFGMHFRFSLSDGDSVAPLVKHDPTGLPTAADLIGNIAARTRIAQKFTAPNYDGRDVYLTAMRVYFMPVGNPVGTVRIRIYSDQDDADYVGAGSRPLFCSWDGSGGVKMSTDPDDFYYQTDGAWPIREAGMQEITVSADGRFVEGDEEWEILGRTEAFGQLKVVVFNGKFYVAYGKLYEWSGSEWVEVAAQYGATLVECLYVYDGALYAGTTGGKLLVWNGTNAWVEKADAAGVGSIYSLVEYDGALYGSAAGRLHVWNGTNAWVEKAPQYGSETEVRSMVSFGGDLYGCTRPNGKLLRWNGTSAWAEKASLGNTPDGMYHLVVFEGAIYGTTSSALVRWNGVNAWTLSAASIGPGISVSALTVFNHRIYAGTALNGRLYVWNGVDAWVMLADTLAVNTNYIMAFAELGGRLYASAYTTSGMFGEFRFVRWGTDSAAVDNIADVFEDYVVNVLGAPSSVINTAALAELRAAKTEEVSLYMDSEMYFQEFVERAEIGQLWRLIPGLDRTFAPRWFDPAAPVDPLHLRDEDFIDGSFRAYRNFDAVRYAVRIRYDVSPGGSVAPEVEVQSAFARFFYGAASTLEIEAWLKVAAEVEAVAENYSEILERPPMTISFAVRGHGFDLLPMDRVKITRRRAPGGSFDGALFRIFRISKRAATATTEITAVLDSEVSL